MNPSPVSLHVWRVPPMRLPAVLRRMAVDRDRLRREPEVRFAKLLGTARARQFGPAQVDPTRWATLVAWQESGDLDTTPVGRAWRALSSSACRLDLAPLASRGRWAGEDPFTAAIRPDATRQDNGMVLALTRARLRPRPRRRLLAQHRRRRGGSPALTRPARHLRHRRSADRLAGHGKRVAA